MIENTDTGIVLKCDVCKVPKFIKKDNRPFKAMIREAISYGWRVEKINGKWFHFCHTEHYFEHISPGSAATFRK